MTEKARAYHWGTCSFSSASECTHCPHKSVGGRRSEGPEIQKQLRTLSARLPIVKRKDRENRVLWAIEPACQPEVENLGVSALGYKNVGRLHVAVDDSFGVGHF